MVYSIPTPALLAVATGITGAAWSSGVIASLSLIGIPAALDLPSPSTTSLAWAGLYNHGITIMPPIAIGVGLSHLYSAYDAKSRGQKSWTGYVVAAGLAVAIVPYTIVMMRATNVKLLAEAAGEGGYRAEEVAGLVRRWGVLNLVRSLLPLASACVGFGTFCRGLS